MLPSAGFSLNRANHLVTVIKSFLFSFTLCFKKTYILVNLKGGWNFLHIYDIPKVKGLSHLDPLCSFARVAVTKGHRLGGSNNRSGSSHSPGGWTSIMQVPAPGVSSGASLLGLRWPPSCLFTRSSLWPCTSLCLCMSLSPLFMRTPVRLD